MPDEVRPNSLNAKAERNAASRIDAAGEDCARLP